MTFDGSRVARLLIGLRAGLSIQCLDHFTLLRRRERIPGPASFARHPRDLARVSFFDMWVKLRAGLDTGFRLATPEARLPPARFRHPDTVSLGASSHGSARRPTVENCPVLRVSFHAAAALGNLEKRYTQWQR